MIINTAEFLKCINVANVFLQLSKFFQTEIKNYIRLYAVGDGKLHIMINNGEDMRIIQTMNIEKGDMIDKVYLITELFTICSNIFNYTTFKLDHSNVIYFNDGKFFLSSISLSEEMKDQYFSIKKQAITEKSFGVDSEIEKEVKEISKIMKMKSESINSYFYRDSNLFFNFKNIYIKKDSIFSFIITDIFSLKMISIILLKNKGSTVFYDVKDDNLVLSSDNFYIESKVFVEDKNVMDQMEKFFSNMQIVSEVKLKLEFFNFISTINYFDSEASIVFEGSNDKVVIQSQYKKSVGEFNITGVDDTFVIMADTLFKILEFYISNSKAEQIQLHIVESCGSKFLLFDINKIKIISEIY